MFKSDLDDDDKYKMFFDNSHGVNGEMRYFIDGVDITDSINPKTGLPSKNRLPETLRDKFFTTRQWLMKGYVAKKEAEAYVFNATRAVQEYKYYYIKDVEPFTEENAPYECYTCKYYVVMGRTIVCTYHNIVGPGYPCVNWVYRKK